MKTRFKANLLLNTFIVTVFSSLLLWSSIASAAVIQIDSSSSSIHRTGGIAGVNDFMSVSGSFNLTQVPFSLDGWDQLIFGDIDIVVGTPGISPLNTPLPASALYNGSIFENGLACIASVGVICPTDDVRGTYDGTNFSMNRFYSDGFIDGFNYEIIINGSVSAVPVPAAVWLFGSGLIGLFGINRRKKMTQD